MNRKIFGKKKNIKNTDKTMLSLKNFTSKK